jgi:exopolysaccharide production protein ExoQ
MSPDLALVFGYGSAAWLIRSDMRWRTAGSKLLLVAALFLGIIGSRPLSYWFGAEGGVDGNPVNTTFFAALMLIALFALPVRGLSWLGVVQRNKTLFLLYAFFALSAFWSIDSSLSLKRLLKDFVCVLLALTLLTERNPAHACRCIFVRVSYVLFPLSLVFGKYFPAIGRSSSVIGEPMFTGVTPQKNSLGEIVLVFGLFLLWDLVELQKAGGWRTQRRRMLVNAGVLGTGVWLLLACDSKTSLACLLLSASVLLVRAPLLRLSNPKAVLAAAFVGLAALFALDSVFEFSRVLLDTLGRDQTFTGRTDIWRVVLAQQTEPIAGGGFYMFWDSYKGRAVAETLVLLNSAHNGYIETYLDGGLLGCALLGLFLLATGGRVFNRYFGDSSFAAIGLPFWLAAIIYNYSEASFLRLDPLWFALLLTTMRLPAAENQAPPPGADGIEPWGEGRT